MSYVFDASALIKAVELAPTRVAKIVKGQYTADLAYYEIGNYIWKLYRKSVIRDLAPHIELFSRLLAIMKVEHVGLTQDVLDLATKREVTYYDASYLWLAEQLSAHLVTEDDVLCRAASKCLSVKDLITP